MRTMSFLLKKSMAGVMIGASLSAVSGIVAVSSAFATASSMVATVNVNLRTGPGTSYGVITYIPQGTAVTASGTITGGWIQVTYNGKTGYVWGTYLQATANTPSGTATVATGNVTTTTNVNVRSGPGTSYSIVGYAPTGKTLPTTGQISGNWTQVVYSGTARWMYSSYLRSGTSAASPTIGGQVRTTANVNLRTDGYITSPIEGVLPADTVVDITGMTTDAYTQIVFSGRLLWIYTSYTASATASAELLTTTTSSLTNPYPGSFGPNGGLTPRAAWLRDQIKARFGLTCTSYVTGDPTSQHYTGNAIDCFGDVNVRRNLQYWAAENARTLEVYYVIHEQRIWTLPSASLGWRPMADRGSWTANHMDHVHISLQNPNNEY